MKSCFIEIVSQEGIDDGLVFDPLNLEFSEIKEDAKYKGVRVKGKAKLVNANISL